jgi:hypothetical protein
VLGRLSKLASVSSSVRKLVEKRAGLIGGTMKVIGKTALNHPGKTTLGVGAGLAGVAAVKENKKGFRDAGNPIPVPGAQ